jgi:hypothetical protein
MEIALCVNNDNLTDTEKEELYPKMLAKVWHVFGQKLHALGYGYCGQYAVIIEWPTSKKSELPAMLRRLAEDTNGMGPLEINEFFISRWEKNTWPYHEIIKR